ncbi:unnamed protein product, partial [Ectocarpus sp. 12 AP-2014]
GCKEHAHTAAADTRGTLQARSVTRFPRNGVYLIASSDREAAATSRDTAWSRDIARRPPCSPAGATWPPSTKTGRCITRECSYCCEGRPAGEREPPQTRGGKRVALSITLGHTKVFYGRGPPGGSRDICGRIAP